MAINPFRRRFIGTPGFAGGTLEEQLLRDGLFPSGDAAAPSRPYRDYALNQPPQEPRKYYVDIGETPIHTKPGGLDMYSDVDRKQGERPIDALRRVDMQRAAIGLGDPVMPGSATFATNTELAGPDRRLSLDYVPTGERTRPRWATPRPASEQVVAAQAEMDAIARDPELARQVGAGLVGPVTPQQREAAERARANDVPPQETAAPASQSPFKQAFNRKPSVAEGGPTFDGKPILADRINGEPFGARPRRTQPRDYVADDAQYLRDLQTQPRNWKDKVVDVIDAVSTGFGNKPRMTMTKRERQIAEAEQRLGTELTVGQKQNAIQAGQMVPVTLEDGTVVEVPARSAGNLQSQQQRIRQQADQALERKRVNSARIKRWERMEARDRKRLLADLYKSGGTNDPEQLEYIADQLGIPGTLRPKFIGGQMRDAIDADGNLIQINRQTGDVTPTGTQSYEVTKQAKADQRSQAGIASRERIAAMPARSGASAGRSVTAGERKDIAETSAIINQVRRQLTDVDSKINAINAKGANASTEEKAQLAVLGRERAELVETGALQADKLNQIDPEREWGSGTGGYPYSKPKPQQGSSDLDRPIYGKPVSGKAKLNEATVRQAAIDAGLDPDEAVRRARAKGRL